MDKRFLYQNSLDQPASHLRIHITRAILLVIEQNMIEYGGPDIPLIPFFPGHKGLDTTN